MKIAYAIEPITAEEKAHLKSNGYRIINQRYAPEKLPDGDILYPQPKRTRKAKK